MKVIELVRWDMVLRKARDLRLQKCDWGGFQQSLLSFVELSSSLVDIWQRECSREHGNQEMKASLYIFNMDRDELINMVELSYQSDKKAKKYFNNLGVHVTLCKETNQLLSICELRIISQNALLLLKDI